MTTTLTGQYQEILERAWLLIRPSGDWRGSIDATIPADEYIVCQAACEHFTATRLEVRSICGETIRVTAAGYLLGPRGACLGQTARTPAAQPRNREE